MSSAELSINERHLGTQLFINDVGSTKKKSEMLLVY